MKIAITGTPGTGKTSVAERLAEQTDMEYVSINKVARKKDCIISYDEKRKSDVVDVKCLREKTGDMEDCILDGHLSHFMENDITFVLRCKPSDLRKRLEGKSWKDQKIQENVNAEITGVIEGEARNGNDEVYSIDTTNKSVDRIVEIVSKIAEEGGGEEYKDHFDWIEKGKIDLNDSNS